MNLHRKITNHFVEICGMNIKNKIGKLIRFCNGHGMYFVSHLYSAILYNLVLSIVYGMGWWCLLFSISWKCSMLLLTLSCCIGNIYILLNFNESNNVGFVGMYIGSQLVLYVIQMQYQAKCHVSSLRYKILNVKPNLHMFLSLQENTTNQSNRDPLKRLTA